MSGRVHTEGNSHGLSREELDVATWLDPPSCSSPAIVSTKGELAIQYADLKLALGECRTLHFLGSRGYVCRHASPYNP